MYRLFSVDDHIIEPPNVWQDRVPAKYKQLAPHVVRANDGSEVWHYEEREGTPTGLYAVAGKAPEDWNSDPVRYEDILRGCYDSSARAKDFLSNGVCASVSFPTLSGFGGDLYLKFKDKELASVCVEAYNDFVMDEWCPGGPKGMFVPMILTKLWDPNLAAAEIYRCAKRGAKAIAFPENVSMLHGLPSFWTDHWDPVWRAAEELDLPICMHIGSGFGAIRTTTNYSEQPATVGVTLGVIGAQKALVDFSMSPVCRKFTKLKIVFSESGIGWIPSTLERVDRQFKRHAAWTKLTGMLPSEIYARNMYFCTIYEPESIKTVGHQVGYDKMLWELDYPHADTPWPDAQAEVRECVEGMTDQQRDAVLLNNAERIFNWKAAELPQEYKQAAE